MTMKQLPRVYVTRHLPQPALDLLHQHTQADVWPDELPPPRAVLLDAIAEVDGLLALLTDRVDAALLDAAPRLPVVSNYAVGYDNVDMPAASARSVMVTNTPDVLTETSADFTWALILAAARRVVEGEAYVKGGNWKTWGPEILLWRRSSVRRRSSGVGCASSPCWSRRRQAAHPSAKRDRGRAPSIAHDEAP